MTFDAVTVAQETRRLLEEATARQEDPLLSFRQVCAVTRTPMSTLKRYVYGYRIIPVEYVCLHLGRPHPRIRASVAVAFFGSDRAQ